MEDKSQYEDTGLEQEEDPVQTGQKELTDQRMKTLRILLHQMNRPL